MKHFPPKDTSTRTSAIQKATHRITTKWLRLAVLAAEVIEGRDRRQLLAGWLRDEPLV